MNAGYCATFHQFTEKPLSDSCWSLSTGPDGRIYASCCVEHTGGESVTVVRYDETRDGVEYLYDVADVCGDPPDSGRATQCKIHYSFAPSPSDGLLYAATHLSGPPKGEKSYCPWSGWHDPVRAFRGAALVAYDTRRDAVAWSTIMIPREGCRCLALDEERGRLYALTYPRDHFVIFDLRTKTLRDVGRIGSVNCQCIFLDRLGRAYFTDDRGRFNRYDPDRERLEKLPWVYPHAAWQTGWHGVLYDAVGDGDCVYMLPWMAGSRLARFWPLDGKDGRLEDLGPVTQERDTTFPISLATDHAGGLVMGIDRKLYFVRSVWPDYTTGQYDEAVFKDSFSGGWNGKGEVVRFDPETRALESVCRLENPFCSSQYASRGARDHAGDLYFGHIGSRPTGFFRMTVPKDRPYTDAHLPLRMWG